MLLVYKHLSILFLPVRSILPLFMLLMKHYWLLLLRITFPMLCMYTNIMDWAHFAQYSKYKFSSALVFRTALHQMHAKYANVSGGSPISEIVTVPGYQPMHVYRFKFLQQAERLFSDSELMKDSLWDYDCSVSSSGERLFSELNTGDFWHLGVEYVSQ